MHSPRRSASPSGARPPGDVRQPGREVAADHVAVARRADPARHQPQRDRVRPAHRHAAHRILHVQQAEVILPPLADHHLAALDRRRRDRAGPARRRSGAADCGCRCESRPARRWSRPTGWPARYSPASCRPRSRPRPARTRRAVLVARAEGLGHGRGVIAWLGRGSASSPSSSASRWRASVGIDRLVAGRRRGASSSHSGRRRQTSSPRQAAAGVSSTLAPWRPARNAPRPSPPPPWPGRWRPSAARR